MKYPTSSITNNSSFTTAGSSVYSTQQWDSVTVEPPLQALVELQASLDRETGIKHYPHSTNRSITTTSHEDYWAKKKAESQPFYRLGANLMKGAKRFAKSVSKTLTQGFNHAALEACSVTDSVLKLTNSIIDPFFQFKNRCVSIYVFSKHGSDYESAYAEAKSTHNNDVLYGVLQLIIHSDEFLTPVNYTKLNLWINTIDNPSSAESLKADLKKAMITRDQKQKDVVSAYKNLSKEIDNAMQIANNRNQSLLILMGETHKSATSAFLEALLLHMVSSKWSLNTVFTESPFEQPPKDLQDAIESLLTELNIRKVFVDLALCNYVNSTHPQCHQYPDISASLEPIIHQWTYYDGVSEKGVLIRNNAMAQAIIETNAGHSVAIVGAAHMYGLIYDTDLTTSYYVLPINVVPQHHCKRTNLIDRFLELFIQYIIIQDHYDFEKELHFFCKEAQQIPLELFSLKHRDSYKAEYRAPVLWLAKETHLRAVSNSNDKNELHSLISEKEEELNRTLTLK